MEVRSASLVHLLLCFSPNVSRFQMTNLSLIPPVVSSSSSEFSSSFPCFLSAVYLSMCSRISSSLCVCLSVCLFYLVSAQEDTPPSHGLIVQPSSSFHPFSSSLRLRFSAKGVRASVKRTGRARSGLNLVQISLQENVCNQQRKMKAQSNADIVEPH